MRYYEVYRPGCPRPELTTSVRYLTGLPPGTRIERIITDRDGSVIDAEVIDIVDGRPAINGHGKQRPYLR